MFRQKVHCTDLTETIADPDHRHRDRAIFAQTFGNSRTEPADALFLRLSGEGDCRVHALTLIAEAAGEVTDRG